MGRVFDENALPAMPVSLCFTPADVPTPTPAGIAVSIPSPAAWAQTCQHAHPGGCLHFALGAMQLFPQGWPLVRRL